MSPKDAPTQMNGAESVVRSLHGAGVDVCFANPGTSEMQFVDALDRTGLMRCVLGLFEGVTTGAADGYARMARKPAVTLLHLAPGLANAGANMHNARKARAPMVNLVGDHAIRHRGYDAPLTADVEGAAAPFSDWVRTAQDAGSFAADAMDALGAAMSRPNKVATLIAPADIGWDPGGRLAAPPPAPVYAPLEEGAVARAAGMLGPDCVILASGTVLETPEAVAQLQGIAAATGATLRAPTSNRRFDRGAGRAPIQRVPYPINMALEALAPFRRAILIEAVPPVAFFAYPGRPSLLLPEGCEVHTLTGRDGDGPAAVAALADRLGAAPLVQDTPLPPAPQAGPITAPAIAAAIANALPEGAIVVDESISGGRDIWGATLGAAPHSWIGLTGGAIGDGIPMALGASVACPDRPVVALQADGSAMYTIQGLWSQAREGCNVTTVVFANRTYEILKTELAAVGANPGPSALNMLDLDRPGLDFVSLARGMGVPGQRVEDVAELMRVLRAAVAEPGPYVIEAAM
ncbi:acetolactate synthase large subunit [Jannaschia seohaensis]|uniref:Acetolactate synthase-1/2/3 large subunit n=1 Tax=Jannaschia seohaensis TaxID=475081 RepID=A0A2Y9AG63_9RHOB|nr:acetolactate synthase large subunit [Jannaschia seohaensis]PWJ20907.1 acetolactate synthase-1/2/3 large subunit [Jannaschia seohaensis]SSA41317.1 acetolactate synthase-1/2/3 large subunit [Jannaschia seohaensis]